MAEHSASKYGIVFCPVENVQTEVDKDGECSACGSSDIVFESGHPTNDGQHVANVEAMKQSIADTTGFDSMTFVSEDGTDSVTYDLKNTEEEATAVDKGVQAELPKDARWHRREARRLLVGKKGMTNEKKVERMQRAKEHLEQAIALEIQSW